MIQESRWAQEQLVAPLQPGPDNAEISSLCPIASSLALPSNCYPIIDLPCFTSTSLTSRNHLSISTMSERLTEFAEIPRQFVKEGTLFVNRCTKPSAEEYKQLCRAVAIGFGVMGVIGYLVKLIHIPINNILVGGA